MKYELPQLNYGYESLEPHIDRETMTIHHTKHHQAYIDNLNEVLGRYPDLEGRPLEKIMQEFETLQMPDVDKTKLKNHGGGHLNHSLFWNVIGPKKMVDEDLVKRISTTFGDLDKFKEEFSSCALKQFGSGWAWLVEDDKKVLSIYSTSNQDSPYLKGDTPILGLDVWEHAYYLKYQNRRAEYIKAWWNVLVLV